MLRSCASEVVDCSDVGTGWPGDGWIEVVGLLLMLAVLAAVMVWVARR